MAADQAADLATRLAAALDNADRAIRREAPLCPCCLEEHGHVRALTKGEHGIYRCPGCEAEYLAGELAVELSALLRGLYS